MYSLYNEGKSVVAKRFIRTIKIKIYKYMTSMSKNMYIDKLNDIIYFKLTLIKKIIRKILNLKLVIM